MAQKAFYRVAAFGALLVASLGSGASAKAPKLPSAIADHTFVCDGTTTVEGTGIDRREVPDTLTVHFGRDINSISTPDLFCTTDRKCQVDLSATAVKLTVKVPIMATEVLSFDWQSETIDYGAGGLDGGRNFHGHCLPDTATVR